MSPLLFLGSKALGLSVFRALRAATPDRRWVVVHPDDRSDPRGVAGDFEHAARSLGCDFMLAASPESARKCIAELSPEAGFVCGWYWLFDAATLAAVPAGLWGLHNSLLPKYRGGSPLVWSILQGDDEVGATVFRMTPGLDDGPVLLQVRVALGPDDGIDVALRDIEAGVLRELPDRWQALLGGRAVLAVQDESAATWCGLRREEDGLIRWSWPARRIHDFVRAQTTPYPGAFTHDGDRRVAILRTRRIAAQWLGTPGQVLRRTPQGVLVACGEGEAIEVVRVRVDGLESDAAEVLRSVRLRLTDAPRG